MEKKFQIHHYCSIGGKDQIREFLNRLPRRESVQGYFILRKLEEFGLKYLLELQTRQIDRKIWEIKFFRHNRIFYIIIDKYNIYMLHACKKQKGKAEKKDIEKAKKRGELLRR